MGSLEGCQAREAGSVLVEVGTVVCDEHRSAAARQVKAYDALSPRVPET